MPRQAGGALAGAIAELRRLIAGGGYAPGSDLPPSRVLADQLGISPETARRALVQLDAELLTAGRRGRPRIVLGAGQLGASRHEQLAKDLRREIGDGALAQGGRLPAESAIAAERGLSRTTVRRAMQVLEAEGVVVVRGGRRYVAGEPAVSDLRHERVAAELRRDLPRLAQAGAALPGEHDLAARFDVSRPTVRRALGQLASEGLVRSEPRVGWFRTGVKMRGSRD